MRKWIDALFGRLGYVPAPRLMTENEYVRAVTGDLMRILYDEPSFDSRGTPCS